MSVEHNFVLPAIQSSNMRVTISYMHAKNVQLRTKAVTISFKVQSSLNYTITFYHCTYPKFDSVNACEGKIDKLNNL